MGAILGELWKNCGRIVEELFSDLWWVFEVELEGLLKTVGSQWL